MTITLKVCYTVKPLEPTPIKKLSLSECDQINAVTHAPTVYFYRPSSTTNPDDDPLAFAIETLKFSLSQTLVHFYPLAGRLNTINVDGLDRLELDCNSMGVLLYDAESDETVDDYGDFRPTPKLRELIPSVEYYTTPMNEIPLLLAQLTRFRCGGTSLGLALSHVMIDGQSALHFVEEWSRISRNLPLAAVPFLDRTSPWLQPANVVPSLRFDHPEFGPRPLLIGKQDHMEEIKKETDVITLTLSKNQIEKLKNQAANDGCTRPYSRYEIVAGHIWRSACKARKHDNNQPTTVRINVDCRNRMDPPFPKAYFGNAVYPTVAIATAGKLKENPLSYAASKIREAVGKMTNEYIRSVIEFLKDEPDLSKYRDYHTLGCTKGAFFGNPNLDITSWITLPLYGADFGWGKEIYMGPGILGFEGKCFILPSLSPSEGGEGDGSLFITIRLQLAHLYSFEKIFYEDI